MTQQDSDVFQIYYDEAVVYIYALHHELLGAGSRDSCTRIATHADGLYGTSVTIGEQAIGEQAIALRNAFRNERGETIEAMTDSAATERFLEMLDVIADLLDRRQDHPAPRLATTLALRRTAHELSSALTVLFAGPQTPAARERSEFWLAQMSTYGADSGLTAITEFTAQAAATLSTLLADPGPARLQTVGQLHQSLGLVTLLEAQNHQWVETELQAQTRLLAARPQAEQPAPTESAPSKRRVLIAANSDLYLQPLLEAFQATGMEILRTDSAQVLRSHLQNHDIALCLMRDTLPNGLETCEQCAGTQGVPPVYVYSPRSRWQREALAKGLAGFLKVPCQPDEVQALLSATFAPSPQRVAGRDPAPD